jgi:hypothetical protein
MNVFLMFLPLFALLALAFFDGYLPYRRSHRK